MKKVHLIHKMSYSSKTDQFGIYDTEVYSNMKVRDWFVEQSIQLNKGNNVKREIIGENEILVTYDAMNTEGNYFKQRYHLLSKDLK